MGYSPSFVELSHSNIKEVVSRKDYGPVQQLLEGVDY